MPTEKVIPFPVVGSSNFQISRTFDPQLAVNWYPFTDTETNNVAQYPYAGSLTRLLFEVSDNPYYGRAGGMIALETLAIVIVGALVYRLDTALSPTLIDTIGTSVGTISMCAGGDYVAFVDGVAGYTYNILTNTFGQITDPAFPSNPTSIEEQNGLFLVNNNGTQTMSQSAPYDPTKWDALTVEQVNYRSSIYSYPLIGIKSVNGRIFAFTSGFLQVYNQRPKAGFAFVADLNLIFGYGAINLASIAKGTGGAQGDAEPEFIIFVNKTLDGANKVLMTSGNAPQVISTPSIEARLNALTNPSDAIAFTWTENGVTFYELSFTTDNLTITYNVNNKSWFDLQTLGNRNFAQAFMFFANTQFVMSYYTASLYEYSESYITNDGVPIMRQRITKVMRAPKYANITGCILELWFEQGVGLSGQLLPDNTHYVYGADPEVFLYVSEDDGQTFENPQTASLGRIGERYCTTRFTGLATSKSLCFNIVVHAPVRVFLIDAQLTYNIASGSG